MLLDDIATYLAAQSTAFTILAGTEGNMTKGFMPDAAPAPDTCTTLYETGGTAPTHTFSTDADTRYFENPRLQIMTRSTSYESARDRADKAFKLLDGLANTVLPTTAGSLYIDISAVQSPFSIGRDANDRFLMSVNFDVMKTVAGSIGDVGAFDSGLTGGFA